MRPKQSCVGERERERERYFFPASSRLLLLCLHPQHINLCWCMLFAMQHKLNNSPSNFILSCLPSPSLKQEGYIASHPLCTVCAAYRQIWTGTASRSAVLNRALTLPGLSGITSMHLFCDNCNYYTGKWGFFICPLALARPRKNLASCER